MPSSTRYLLDGTQKNLGYNGCLAVLYFGQAEQESSLKKVGVALGGGGAKGVAHIAYLKAMEELGITPCVISGTSSGSIAGALYAGGMKADNILEVLHSMFTGKKSSKLLKSIVKFKKNLVTDTARKILEEILPVQSFGDLKIPLKVVATNINTLEEKVFTSGSLLDAVMCSVALPGTILPQENDGQYYIDGGATNVVPFDIIRDDCDVLVAIDVSRVRPNTLEPTMRTAELADWTATHNALISLKRKHTKVEVFEQPDFGKVGTMAFDQTMNVYKRAEELVPDFKRKLEKYI
jgi:NTE family protein